MVKTSSQALPMLKLKKEGICDSYVLSTSTNIYDLVVVLKLGSSIVL